MEKRGKDILMMFICCRGANREGKVTNSGVVWDRVNKRRSREEGRWRIYAGTGDGEVFPLKELYQNSSLKGNHWLSTPHYQVSLQHLSCFDHSVALNSVLLPYLPCLFMVI